jgi:Flp pilus assembly protein TadG
MAAINSPHFNWLPQTSMWQDVQNERIRQANLQDAADTTTAIVSKLTNAGTNQISGAGSLAAKAALARIQAATAAKRAKQQAQADLDARNAPLTPKTPQDVTLSDGTIIRADASITLAGGTKINAAAGTLTLPDGTLVSILTGLKIDVTA